MGLALREAATVLDSHGLADDEFGDFGVGTIHTLVVDIECVALAALHYLYFRARRHYDIASLTHARHHVADAVYLLLVSRAGGGNAQRHAEDLAEDIPCRQYVLLRYAVERSFEVEAEVVGSAHLDEIAEPFRLVVVDARSPVLSEVGDDAVVLWYDVLAIHQRYIVISEASVAIGTEVSEFDERVPPVGSSKHQAAELHEPFLLEEVVEFFGWCSILVFQLE